MFKKILTGIALIVASTTIAQTINVEKTSEEQKAHICEKAELKSVSIEVSVDSLEELKTTFTKKDIKEILDHSAPNEEITFKIVCNGRNTDDGLKSHATYEIKGNTDDKDFFLNLIGKVRTAAIKYYKS